MQAKGLDCIITELVPLVFGGANTTEQQQLTANLYNTLPASCQIVVLHNVV